jgi:hypothetical protein
MLKLKDQDSPAALIYGLKEIGYGKKIPEPIKTVMDVGRFHTTINSTDLDIGKTGKKEIVGCREDGIRFYLPKQKRFMQSIA